MTDKQQAIFDLIVELKERFERTRTELADLNRWIQEEAPRIAVEESRKVLERAEKAEAENAQLREALRDLLKELQRRRRRRYFTAKNLAHLIFAFSE